MQKIPLRELTTLQHQVRPNGQFKIRQVADIVGENDLFHDLHRHTFFFILAIEYGDGSHEIDFTNYKVVDRCVFFLKPGQVHRLQLKAGAAGYLLEFNPEFYSPKDNHSGSLLRKASNRNYCKLEQNGFKKLQVILNSMFDEQISKEEGYQEITRSALDIFLIEYLRQSSYSSDSIEGPASYTRERFEEFTGLLEKHISTHKQVGQYTGLMNLSAFQLNGIAKSSTGKTVSELINEHILLEAKRYLLATSNQVKDIADILGYEDASYFIRFFKKHTGCSPELFRQRSK